MPLVRWRPDAAYDPWSRLTSLERDMDRLFGLTQGGSEMSESVSDWIPALDVRESENEIILELEAPGLKEEDLNISISDGTLSIKGEKKREEEKEEGSYHVVERSYGSFQRAIPLPSNVDEDKAKADFKNGVLKVKLPKNEEAKPKQIKVES